MSKSSFLYQKAKHFIPGGVNSPVRSFIGVDSNPIFIHRADGAYLYDVDNNIFIDYVGSWGPMILGHNNINIRQAVIQASYLGLSFGAPHKSEIQMAELLCNLISSMDMVRLVNSGTEATMSAIRLARGFNNRDKIIKFEGCYHGHADHLLVKSGSGSLTVGIPSSLGIPNDFTKHTLICEYNNLSSVRDTLIKYAQQISCIIVEPIAGNMNCVLPKSDFLPGLRSLCDEFDILLIMDEVMTGFRIMHGSAQKYYNVKPDLTCLGKIIGGGLPVGAFGGRRDIMNMISPTGPIYQAGTLSGNPIAIAAGYECLLQITKPGCYEILTELTNYLAEGLRQAATNEKINIVVNNVGGMFGIFFTDKNHVNNYQDVLKSDLTIFKKFFHLMLKEKIYLAPSAFESCFMSLSHTFNDIDNTISAAKSCFKKLKKL